MTTWAGCGSHVDQVMAAVPAGQRCPGHADAVPRRRGIIARLLSRR